MMPDQLLVLQASSQGGDWMSVIGRPVSQSPHQPPFPPGTSPSHYALHQAPPPAAQTAGPHAVTSPFRSDQSYLPHSQVECLSSCPSPSCQTNTMHHVSTCTAPFNGSRRHSVNSTQGHDWKAAGTLTNPYGLLLFQSLLSSRPAHIQC